MNMNENKSVITIKTPEKVFFSKEPIKYKVQNNFYFSISLNDLTSAPDGGESCPKIYIKGFEELFTDDAQRNNILDALTKNFKTGGNPAWKMRWGIFEEEDDDYCIVIEYLRSNPNISVKFELSERCVLTNYPGNLLNLTAYAYGFNGIEDGTKILITAVTCEYASYIKNFGGYVNNSKVNSVYKGEECNISWEVMGNDKVSVFLYNENGEIVANLPGEFNPIIDKDKRFTLMIHGEYCTQLESINIHRTLWKKSGNLMNNLPPTDSKGRFKFYKNSSGTYYLYIHPALYESKDFVMWEKVSVNSKAPADYTFYSSSFSEDRFAVCYLSDTKVCTYCEMDFKNKSWKEPIKINKVIAINAHAFLKGNGGVFCVICDEKNVIYAELRGNILINPEFLRVPKNGMIKAVDILDDEGKYYVAVLTEMGRVYFYDLENDFRNNIFECPNTDDDYISLVKSNAVYIALKGYMFEINDREKFTDINFSPKYKNGIHPIIGSLDNETVAGVFTEGNSTNIWKYKF